MTRRIVADGGPGAADTSDEAIARRLESGEFFWLDLRSPDEADTALLRDRFGLHPLALEDASEFGQRAKVEEYDDVAYIVAFGATPPPDMDRLVELHVVYSERFMVTLRRDDSPAIDEVVHRCAVRPALLDEGHPILLYQVLDAMTDSFFPAMDELDAEIDEIERSLDEPPRDGLQGEIFDLRRRVVQPSAGGDAAARPDGADRSGAVPDPRGRPRGAPLLPRRRGPPHPDRRAPRRLPRPALGRVRRLPLVGLEPAQRGHQAARRDRRDLPAPHLHHRASSARTSGGWSTTSAGPAPSSASASACRSWPSPCWCCCSAAAAGSRSLALSSVPTLPKPATILRWRGPPRRARKDRRSACA